MMEGAVDGSIIYDGSYLDYIGEFFSHIRIIFKEELTLFIERMRHYHLPYLVLQVNQLPFKLQEVSSAAILDAVL